MSKGDRLTKQFIEGLSRAGSYYDSEVRGFCVRVSPAGKKSFYVYRRFRDAVGFESKPTRVKIGDYPEMTVEQARRRAEEINAVAAIDNHPLKLKRDCRNSPTLGHIFAEYMVRHVKKRRKQIAETEKNFARWFGHWSNRKVITITRGDVEHLHGEIGDQRGRYSANRALELLRAIFNKAIEWGLLEEIQNPATRVTLFAEASRERYLQEDEIGRFFQALETEPNEDLRDFVLLTLYTGQRKSNVLGMRWQDIDFQGQTWRIPGEMMKNGQTHTIALTETELSILRRRFDQRKNEFVFYGTGGTGHFVEPKKPWKKLLERAGIENLHIHDLRRSLATWMANSGANIALIKNALNHKDIKTTLSVYALTSKAAEREAREVAHRKMQEVARESTSNVVPFRKRGLG